MVSEMVGDLLPIKLSMDVKIFMQNDDKGRHLIIALKLPDETPEAPEA